MEVLYDDVQIETDLDLELELEGEREELTQGEELLGIPDEFHSLFSTDIKALAQHHIDKFFADKDMYFGGKIPKGVLQNPKYTSMVLNTDMEGAKKAYAALETCSFTQEARDGLPEDVRLVISILDQCAVSRVPKVFAAGLMLMYLEVCEGVVVE